MFLKQTLFGILQYKTSGSKKEGKRQRLGCIYKFKYRLQSNPQPKGGINSYTKALDLGQYGIRVNVLLPDTIKTARWVEMGSKQIINGTLTPIGDISDFEDLANDYWFIGTDMSKNITGTELTIDGVMTCQLYPKILNELIKKDRENKL